jgi:hypothetical protein
VYGKTLGRNVFMKNKIIMAELQKDLLTNMQAEKKDDYE